MTKPKSINKIKLKKAEIDPDSISMENPADDDVARFSDFITDGHFTKTAPALAQSEVKSSVKPNDPSFENSYEPLQ